MDGGAAKLWYRMQLWLFHMTHVGTPSIVQLGLPVYFIPDYRETGILCWPTVMYPMYIIQQWVSAITTGR